MKLSGSDETKFQFFFSQFFRNTNMLKFSLFAKLSSCVGQGFIRASELMFVKRHHNSVTNSEFFK